MTHALRRCLRLATLFAALTCGLAAAGPDDVAKLEQLSDAWDKAIVAGIVDEKLTINPYTVEDFEVRLYGDTALLSGRSRMTGVFDGKPFESNYRYIDVHVRRGGAWKIVSVQITKFPPA